MEADIEAEEGVVHHPVKDFTGTVAALEDIARETRRASSTSTRRSRSTPASTSRSRFPVPGQTRTWSDGQPACRAARIELQIRRTPGGLGTDGWVFKNLAVGDTVRLSGPYGRFFLRGDRPEPMILIGGGTGLAPLKAIVRHVLESGLDQRMYLYQGPVPRPTSTTSSSSGGSRRRTPTSSPTGRASAATSRRLGRPEGFGDRLVDADFETCRKHTAYLCGPPPMVEAALKTLMRKRLFPKDIYREDFFDASDKATGGVRSPLLKG